MSRTNPNKELDRAELEYARLTVILREFAGIVTKSNVWELDICQCIKKIQKT